MGELKVIESELVPVYQTDTGQKVVYGTELYECLGSKRQYTDWIRERFSDCDAIENKDFQSFSLKNEKGGRPKTEYIIQLATAKEMAMLERNDKGKKVRRYFISVEEKYKESVQAAITHNVKQLTITSRELTILAKEKRALHCNIMFRIRECITELQEMGLNPDDYFMESEYLGGNNEMRPQYLVTEQGCEYYASRITLNRRNDYRSEYMLRFDQLRALAEGKTLDRKLPKLICLADVEEKEPQIQLYKTDSGGIVLLDGEVYSLTPDEIEALSLFIPEMQKYNIGQIQYAVSAFLKSMKRSGRLEKIASWGLGKEVEPQQKEEQTKKKSVTPDLSQVLHLTMQQAQQRYGMGRTNLMNAVEVAGAKFKNGNRILINREIMDKYFERQTY